MRMFKWIDAFISLALIVACSTVCLKGPEPGMNALIGSYFIVGGWQTISMIVHAVTKTKTRRYGTRYVYHWITFISLVLLPVGFAYILLFTAPFMAMFYLGLCFSECLTKIERPLSVLKN